jgi:hypothetical protein
MHWIVLAVLAIGAGFLYPLLSTKLQAFVPGSLTGNAVGQAFFTGAFILLTVIVATFVLKLFFGSRVRVPA